MPRKRKPQGYSILFCGDIGGVSEDGNYTPGDDVEPSLFDKLECPIADEVLTALRKSFSLTYPDNPFLEGLLPAIAEIRRIGVEAMKPMPEVLAQLDLSPLPPITDDPVMRKAHVFMLVFARNEDIDIRVKHDGKRKRFLDVVQHQEATQLLTTLRSVITDTFAEAHDEDQHMAILLKIREKIWDVLPDFNGCLDAIEIEPITPRLRFEDEES